MNNWETLKKIIDEEVASGRGTLIDELDDTLYGIKVNNYRFTFFSTFGRTRVERTWFEDIPTEALNYYNKILHPKIKDVIDNGNNPLLNAMDGIK